MIALILCVVLVSALICTSTKHFFLLTASALIRVVLWLWQSIRQVQEVLRYPDCAQQVQLCVLIVKDVVGHQLFDLFADYRHLEDFLAAWPHLRSNLNQVLYCLCQVVRKDVWDFGINAAKNFLVEALHVLGTEWGFQGH